MKIARLCLLLLVLVPSSVPAQDASASKQPEIGTSLQSGINFLTQQNAIYARNAWLDRYAGWILGWGAAVLAAFTAVSAKLFPNSTRLPIWTGLLAAALVSVTQTVKPEVWADAYYRGHILIENVLGDAAIGKATADDLSNAWHQAQGGLPGVTPALQKASGDVGGTKPRKD